MSRPSRHRSLAGALVLLAGAGLLARTCVGCGPAESRPNAGSALVSAQVDHEHDDPPTALRRTLDELRRAQAAPRHPSDGGGRAWLELEEDQEPSIQASSAGRWTIVYEAGPHGVQVGGTVRLVISPYWYWSPAQVNSPQALGYTTVESLADGVELEVNDYGWIHAVIRGRALEEGERIRMVYGAGPDGARADRYAEKGARFWVAVDGDGDGVHGLLLDSPTVDVTAGPPRILHLVLPSTAHPGDEVELRVSLLDWTGNAGYPWEGRVQLLAIGEVAELPEPLVFEARHAGSRSTTIRVTEPCVLRVIAKATPADGKEEDAIAGESNPLLVEESSPRILWGDLHGHSNLSDGTGTPEDYLSYARDVAGLDVISLTDHDHWGMRPLEDHPELWTAIQETTKRFHEPEKFVTLLGFEWTNWIHGHRHVLYFEDQGEIFSSVDPDWETPAQLWDGLRGQEALTFAHHSAGGPIATNWDYPPDPEFEPVTEITSVHGCSEALDAPQVIYSPLQGNFARDILDRGYQLGFIGSGDSHDGHPGLSQIAARGKGGIAAILSEELTRRGVFDAMHARRVYASNGPRIILRCALGGHRLGSTIEAAELENPAMLYVRAIACAPLQRIDLIRSGEVVQSIDAEEAWDYATTVELDGLKAGEYVYVRAVQVDRGTAWSSPFFLE